MPSENKSLVWFAGIWSVILAFGLSWYLVRSLKRGVVAIPARISRDVSRRENPGSFWFVILTYLVVDLFAIGGVAFRLYLWIFRTR